MIIMEWLPKEGCNGLKHRREKHFTCEVAVIQKTSLGYRCPITIRAYRASYERVSFCIWVHYGNYSASGSAMGRDRGSLMLDLLASAGFSTTRVQTHHNYDLNYMVELAQQLVEFFKMKDYYIHEAHS